MELIGVTIAAIIALIGALGLGIRIVDRRRKALLDQDLNLEVIWAPQENFRDTVGFVLKNIGGTCLNQPSNQDPTCKSSFKRPSVKEAM